MVTKGEKKLAVESCAPATANGKPTGSGGRLLGGGINDPSSMLNDVKVVQGLRRAKPKNAGGGGVVGAVGVASGPEVVRDVRPLNRYPANTQDRLCEVLLPWRLLDELSDPQQLVVSSSGQTKDSELPLTYGSYDEYLETWEPLLTEEIKAGILSQVSHVTKPKSARVGSVNVFISEDSPTLSTITLGWHQVGGVDARESHNGSQFSAYDLVLLSISSPMLPLNSNTAQRFVEQPLDGQIYFLALVTESVRGHKGSGQAVTIKADRRAWTQCVEQLSQRCPTSNPNVPGAKVKISTSRGLKTAYRMHYIVLDSLVSFWREFMALHDLRTNRPPLMPQILARDQLIEMPPTPEHRPPEFFRRDSAGADSPSSQWDDSPREDRSRKPWDHFDGTANTDNTSAAAATAAAAGASEQTRANVESLKFRGEAILANREARERPSIEWKSPPPGITQCVLKRFRSMFNDSQLLSVKTAAEQDSGLTLIQGPPGTGKTTTAIGILNAVHLTTYHKYYEQLISAVLGGEGVSCRNHRTGAQSDGVQLPPGHDPQPWVQLVSRVSKCKPHLLVAAPSNVAVDNIVQRIIQRGFLDGNGNTYNPSILRVGGGKSDAVQDVSLEWLVDADDLTYKSRDSGATGPVTDQDRRNALRRIVAEMRVCVQDIYRFQSMLLNLRLAFQQHPLPTGWELRVEQNTALPYWVDHLNQRAQNTPPEPAPPEPDDMPPSHGGEIGRSDKFGSLDAVAPPNSPSGFVFEPKDADGKTPISAHDAIAARDTVVPLPPPAPTPASITYSSCAQLPEFQHYSTLICQSLEHLDKLKLQHSRCHARVDPNMYGGPSEARHAIESSCVDSAHVVFSTLNSTASPVLEMSEFQITLIDEAAQCSEPSLLIALRKRCRHCIMVGDPQQLPATIFSDVARSKGYNRSLFERLMRCGQPSILLNVQYRMAPPISHFSNHMFYEGRLLNGSNVSEPIFYPPFICPLREAANRAAHRVCLDPFMFFDLSASSDDSQVGWVVDGTAAESMSMSGEVSSGVGGSKSNPQEARLCLSILKTLLLASLSSGGPGSVGVITPYQEQLSELRRLFEAHGIRHGAHIGSVITQAQESLDAAYARALGCHTTAFKQAMQSATLDLELNTVDGFQGKEKDIIIISCVRANDFGAIGFLSDTRRMNVALTRAKYGLFVVGNAGTLQHNETWNDLLSYAEHCESLVHVSRSDEDLFLLLQDRREKIDREVLEKLLETDPQQQQPSKRAKIEEEEEEDGEV